MVGIKSDDWAADINNMTCRNKVNNMAVSLEKCEHLFIGKIIDVPKELAEQWAAEPDGEKKKERAVMEAEAAFFWAYNEKAIRKYQRREKKELERLKAARMGVVRFEKFWKSDLQKTANDILKLYGKKASDKQVYALEKRIMESIIHFRQNEEYYFSAKRKYPKKIGLRSFPLKADKAEDGGLRFSYDLRNGKNTTVKLRDLCAGITHVTIHGNYISGVFFSADNGSSKALYLMDFIVLSKILFSLIEDKEIGIEPEFDDNGQITEFKLTDKRKKEK